ncbi:hypothetical protein [Tunturibacter empetritectus]|uniref:Uncharacterized protein n=1 Tax=Tunturiibacter lichenicola TaxID=2051959 RepID=A0A7W8J4H4_9BACT|nr:hypothetical protein [Edaphobacter lichenicola]MBB5342495.1 hypothetical protein [Edaphobacter lichenicola]
MNVRICLKTLCVLIVGGACLPLYGTTWYVRPDGGTRYSSNVSGQCDGKADAAPSGGKSNQHCAFKDVRMLWQDGSYSNGTKSPSWGWVIAGGDTVIIRGSIGTGVSYRIGWDHPSYSCEKNTCWGLTGDAYSSGAPPPPSGTAAQHTRILGENYASCRSASAKTQLHGGWAVFNVLDLSGTSYVDVACLDITDFSACGKAAQKVGCDSSQDFAQNGIRLNNKTTNLTMTDLRLHGLAVSGIAGPTGDGVVMDYIDILGNASSGWNADDGTTGKGSLLVQHYDISWNGCAEEYPIVHPLPYGDCTDQDHGGYGDGFGTATKDSDPPGWQVHFDKGTTSYNTQDGLDALHIGGAGSSMTVTDSLAFSNMGQQLKVGGATATLIGNYVVGNCSAMSHEIPGTPPGYNAQLSQFCRAGDTAIFIDMPVDRPAIFQRNIVYSNNHVALELEYVGDPSPRAAIKYDNNIFVGFPNSEGNNPSPIYSTTDLKMLTNPGASFTNNVTYHPKGDWGCPATSLQETGGSCSNPHLKDETWHPYGHGDLLPIKAGDKSSSQLAPEPHPTLHSSTVIKSLGAVVLATGAWQAWRYLRDRTTKA